MLEYMDSCLTRSDLSETSEAWRTTLDGGVVSSGAWRTTLDGGVVSSGAWRTSLDGGGGTSSGA
jgi:hypothetical protein